MHITLGIKNTLSFIALILGIAAFIVPRHIHYIVACFLICFALVGFGLVR